jgi:hypothetical protein
MTFAYVFVMMDNLEVGFIGLHDQLRHCQLDCFEVLIQPPAFVGENEVINEFCTCALFGREK